MKKIHGFPLEQVFREAYLAQLGASFAEFQKDPRGTLEKYGQHDAVTLMRLGYQPLLPVQVHLRRTLEAQWRAEGTWDDSMAAHAASPAPGHRFFKRFRRAIGSLQDTLKPGMPEHAEPIWDSHTSGLVATPPLRRQHTSHGMP